MDKDINIEIVGLGIIFYSPRAVSHIKEGEDYLEAHFWEPDDVARHVMDCQISAFATGSPGRYTLRLRQAIEDPVDLLPNEGAIRLGIEVHDSVVCFRDLYELMEWCAECPPAQTVCIDDGFYRITVITSLPASGIIGDGQVIDMVFVKTDEKPMLRWPGVPNLEFPGS